MMQLEDFDSNRLKFNPYASQVATDILHWRGYLLFDLPCIYLKHSFNDSTQNLLLSKRWRHMSLLAFQITRHATVSQQLVEVSNNENIKAVPHCPAFSSLSKHLFCQIHLNTKFISTSCKKEYGRYIHILNSSSSWLYPVNKFIPITNLYFILVLYHHFQVTGLIHLKIGEIVNHINLVRGEWL